MKVLVVDDSRISRIKVIQLLTKLGHETTIEAKDGQEAVEKYKEFQPDIILSDYEMPVMNGIEMAKKIYEINKNAIIIIVTSLMDKKIALQAIRLGVKTIMTKPVSLEELKEELQKYE